MASVSLKVSLGHRIISNVHFTVLRPKDVSQSPLILPRKDGGNRDTVSSLGLLWVFRFQK